MEERQVADNCFKRFVSPNIVEKLCDCTFVENTNAWIVHGIQWKKLRKEKMYVNIALNSIMD